MLKTMQYFNRFVSTSIFPFFIMLSSTYACADTSNSRESSPFSVWMDGNPWLGTQSLLNHTAKPYDYGVSLSNIQVNIEGLNIKPKLNIGVASSSSYFDAGSLVPFTIYSNYLSFIDRAEIRIQDSSQGDLVAKIPVTIGKHAHWVMPSGGSGSYTYSLRVYGAQGNFDETHPKTLTRSTIQRSSSQPMERPSLDVDNTSIRSIPVQGSAVTLYGSDIPENFEVVTLGHGMDVREDQSFTFEQILPYGLTSLDIEVFKNKKVYSEFIYDVFIPSSEWFYVGIADLTVGYRTGGEDISEIRSEKYDEMYSKGRLAFYVKGRFHPDYQITASADTRENDLSDLFKNFDKRDPKYLLMDQLDVDAYYSTYGDDSTMYDDAPSSGKFYVRFDHGDSHIMWGDAKANLNTSTLLRTNRDLYGAHALYQSQAITSFGDRRVYAQAYGAQPESVAQRDLFLATGGSTYFLKYRDINRGSESLSVEIRDPFTGHTLSSKRLYFGEDYRIDYRSGLIFLNHPLEQLADKGPLRESIIGDYKVWLLAEYEFTPLDIDFKGYSFGGHAHTWLSDHLRLGLSGVIDDRDLEGKQEVISAEVKARFTDKSFVSAEIAQSMGSGVGYHVSYDGGLESEFVPGHATESTKAKAFRADTQIDLKDISEKAQGVVSAYYEYKEDGFSTLAEEIKSDRALWGIHLNRILLSDASDLFIHHDGMHDEEGRQKIDTEMGVNIKLSDSMHTSLGVSHLNLESQPDLNLGREGLNGERVDLGARIEFETHENKNYYLFGQSTLYQSGDIDKNNRIGLGARLGITEKMEGYGELSYGNSGYGALLGLSYTPLYDTRYYIGYRLDQARAEDLNTSDKLIGSDRGTLVSGANKTLNETLNFYGEQDYDMFGKRKTLSQKYGVNWALSEQFYWDVGFTLGQVFDNRVRSDTGLKYEDTDRYNLRSSLKFIDPTQTIEAMIAGELRLDRSEDSDQDRNTLSASGKIAVRTSENWRWLARLDAVTSDGNKEELYDGDYVEGSIGYAYRPANFGKLNALVGYTYLYDRPSRGQFSGVSGDDQGPMQRAHILSVDATYKFKPWMSIGGKYAIRVGESRYRLKDENDFSPWRQSNEQLLSVRGDIHIVKNWDLLLEGRIRSSYSLDTSDYGILTGAWRHLGNHIKVGVGYNFGIFSDDLRDQTYNDQGFFFNLLGTI